jgi:hypothetical protein
MRLKMFIFHNPAGFPEKVFSFPWSDAIISEIATMGMDMYSRDPMKRPILHIHAENLTEIKNQLYTVTEEDYRFAQE